MDETITKRIDGVLLSQQVLDGLTIRIQKLIAQSHVPTLAVIQVGDSEDSTSYVDQKQKTARKIGARVLVKKFPETVFFQELAEAVHRFNADRTVNGIIIQRPLPAQLSTSSFNSAVELDKDVDGFRPKSPYKPPIALAVLDIFRHIYDLKNVTTHLKNKQIVIIGRGETAGKPIADLLSVRKIPFIQCHSQTTNMDEFTKEADIIISCVGKPNVITNEHIKEGVILIGVGLSRDKNGKYKGDYEESDIREKAGYYTPIPGGIGPLNVAYLLSNLIKAAEKNMTTIRMA